MATLTIPDWFDVFAEVCSRSQGALEWGLPEAWVHAELFAALKRQAHSSGCAPFPNEVPYVTLCPVNLPKKGGRDWKTMGAVKWADLCLHSAADNHWCWCEFKVRQVLNSVQLEKDSLDAFRKDAGGLIGFDISRTADAWEHPDENTKAYWFDTMLKPHVQSLRTGHHCFVVAFLQCCFDLHHWAWDENRLIDQVRKWVVYRQRQAGRDFLDTDFEMKISQRHLPGGYWLILAEIEKSDRRR